MTDNMTLSLWEAPGQSRAGDPSTSQTAALSVRPGSARYALLRAHLDHPHGLTDEEAAEFAGLSLRSEYATRCSELSRSGLLEDTGETRPGDSGLARIVRRITTNGRRELGL